MSHDPYADELRLRLQELEHNGVSIDEYKDLASHYLRLTERFDKVLEISDKFQRLLEGPRLGNVGTSQSSSTKKQRSSTEFDVELEAVIDRVRSSDDAEARTLAKHFSKLRSRLAKIMAISDVYQSQLRETTLRLEMMARTDTLTELANRRDMTEHLIMEWARSARSGLDFGVAVFDIDNFKNVNDTHGHAAGDKVLIEVARTLTSTIRTSDLCARWGGEEFLLLCPETNLHQLQAVAEKCRRAIEELAIPVDRGILEITISGGVAATDLERLCSLEAEGSDGWECLVRYADEALYEAKALGKNRVVLARS